MPCKEPPGLVEPFYPIRLYIWWHTFRRKKALTITYNSQELFVILNVMIQAIYARTDVAKKKKVIQKKNVIQSREKT